MSLKGKYDVCKEGLSDKIFTAIRQFEESTGCSVVSINVAPMRVMHSSNKEDRPKLVALDIKTDIDI